MTRFTRTLAAGSAVLTLLAATTAVAQSGDSTRTPPPPPRDGMMGPRGQRPGAMRFGPDGGRRSMMRERQERGARGRGAGMRGGGMRSEGPRALLRGITLSTEQERALRQQQAKHLIATKPLMLEMMSARTDQELARLNGDQKALDAATARATSARTKLDSLRAQRSPTTDLRAVLTPDQQKILDQNLSQARNRARPGMRPPGPRGARDGAPARPPRGGDGFMRRGDDADAPTPRDETR